MHPDELIDRWTLVPDELALMHGKASDSRLSFALLLKFFTQAGRFPRSRSEIPDEAVEYVARQLAVPAADLGSYDWSGRTIERHRAQIYSRIALAEAQ